MAPSEKPSLDALINTYDFEAVASRTLTVKTWAFYSSAATDLHTKHRNASAFADIGLRPRVMRNVRDCDVTTKMLGQKINVPIFCSPAALAKMVHPEGEKELARGCMGAGVPQCISTAASFPVEEIFGAVEDGANGGSMPFFFQLYVDKQRKKSERLLKHVEQLDAKAIMVTVDAPVAGKKEAHERVKADEGMSAPMSGAKAKNDKKGGSLGRIMAGFIDPTLTWDDIPWL
jgi:L-lactate dehydrogenase (cytochrome)